MITVEDLRAAAAARGCHLTPSRMTAWRSWGLLPPLVGGSHGRGRGRKYFWRDPEVLDRAVTADWLLARRSRTDYALVGLWYAGFRVDPRKGHAALLREAQRVQASIVAGARRYRSNTEIDRLGDMAATIARHLAVQQSWDVVGKQAMSDFLADLLPAFAGLETLGAEVMDPLQVVLGRMAPAMGEEASEILAEPLLALATALSPPNRVRALKAASLRDLQRAHRYWRAAISLMARIMDQMPNGTLSVGLKEWCHFSVFLGGMGAFELLLSMVSRGDDPRLRATFLLCASRSRQAAVNGWRASDNSPEFPEVLFPIWSGWKLGA
jgi:hypothetical protein